jgi:hypothetical protein
MSQNGDGNENYKLLSDDSILDEIQLYNKQQSSTKSATTTNTNSYNENLNKIAKESANAKALLEKKSSSQKLSNSSTASNSKINNLSSDSKSLTATTTSLTTVSDEDLSISSMPTAMQPSMAKLMNELNTFKEKEKAYLEQISSLEDENEKFK